MRQEYDIFVMILIYMLFKLYYTAYDAKGIFWLFNLFFVCIE